MNSMCDHSHESYWAVPAFGHGAVAIWLKALLREELSQYLGHFFLPGYTYTLPLKVVLVGMTRFRTIFLWCCSQFSVEPRKAFFYVSKSLWTKSRRKWNLFVKFNCALNYFKAFDWWPIFFLGCYPASLIASFYWHKRFIHMVFQFII